MSRSRSRSARKSRSPSARKSDGSPRRSAKEEETVGVFIHNLPRTMKKDELEDLIRDSGAKALKVELITFSSGDSKGMATAQFDDKRDADDCIKFLDKKSVEGRDLVCREDRGAGYIHPETKGRAAKGKGKGKGKRGDSRRRDYGRGRDYDRGYDRRDDYGRGGRGGRGYDDWDRRDRYDDRRGGRDRHDDRDYDRRGGKGYGKGKGRRGDSRRRR